MCGPSSNFPSMQQIPPFDQPLIVGEHDSALLQEQASTAKWNQLSLLLCAIDKVTSTNNGHGDSSKSLSRTNTSSSLVSVPHLTDDSRSTASSSPAGSRLPPLDIAVSLMNSQDGFYTENATGSLMNSQEELYNDNVLFQFHDSSASATQMQLPFPMPIQSFSQGPFIAQEVTLHPEDNRMNVGVSSNDAQVFVCSYAHCKRSFTRYYNLKSHMRTHTNDRPYTCDICNAGFSRMHDLKRHANVHSGKRTFQCPYCDKSFSRLDAVNRHKNTACKKINYGEDTQDRTDAQPSQ